MPDFGVKKIFWVSTKNRKIFRVKKSNPKRSLIFCTLISSAEFVRTRYFINSHNIGC